MQKFTFKMPQTKTGDHTLCEPAPSKFISTLHKKHFMQEFTGKMPRTKIAARPTLCASLRNRNALGHCTRSTSCENLQVKCRGLAGAGAPRPGTALCASLRLWTFHKRHVMRKITGKMLPTSWSTLIKHRPLHLP